MNSLEQSSKPLLLTLEECAISLRMSIRSLYREIAAGHFPRPVKIGRSTRVPFSSLEAYVKRLSDDRVDS